MMHIHLDAVGGVAGDMFVASLLDAFPELSEQLLAFLGALPLPNLSMVSILAAEKDEVMTGLSFSVAELGDISHNHTHWSDIRQWLLDASLPSGVASNALGIFETLAKAEARVHGVAESEVTFHEVGALDSIIDIIAAAYLIDALAVDRWSVSSLPLGSGLIGSAHGALPVPAPAVAWLLRGFVTHDDGIPGERVTPTGAAILVWLNCLQEPWRSPRRLARSGIGLGSRRFAGLSNCLRTLCFEPLIEAPAQRELAVIEFEIDDQSAEDLAMGLDQLRRQPGVLDVLQMPFLGKKGRLGTHVRILALPGNIGSITNACFVETTTIGLRYQTVQGITLCREILEIPGADRFRVKVVERPGSGRTAKAESKDLADCGNHAERMALRRAAENAALDFQQESRS